jgi:hypothetical protein
MSDKKSIGRQTLNVKTLSLKLELVLTKFQNNEVQNATQRSKYVKLSIDDDDLRRPIGL